MKLQILQENLAKGLTLASRFVSSKAQLPILGNILLSASKNKLMIGSTNLEISVSVSVGAKVEKEGSLTIPARVISDLITNLAPGPINLEAQKETLKVESPNFSLQVSGMDSTDFPSIPKNIDEKSLNLSLSKEEFVNALSKVLFATSIDETRPVLGGVLFLFTKDLPAQAGGIVLVATDGFRLSQKRLNLKKAVKLDKIIIPKAVLGEIGRLSEEEETISLSFLEKENQAIFGISDVILSTRTLEGNFPDFEKIIPKDSTYKIFMDKEEFLRAVKSASVFARDSANIVKLRLGKDSVEVSSESQSGNQKGKVDARVEGPHRVVSAVEPDFEIAFNYRFLEDFLHAVDGEEILIELSGADKPGVFTDPKDPSFLHLIMPVSIQS